MAGFLRGAAWGLFGCGLMVVAVEAERLRTVDAAATSICIGSAILIRGVACPEATDPARFVP